MVTHTIETYGRALHNRNIWPSATERQTIETYGRHAWPILLSVLVSPLYTLLICMHVCIYICVCMYVCVHVYVCMHNISGRELSGGSKCPTQNGRGNCPGNCPGVNCPGELSVGIVLHPQLNEAH